MVTSSVARGGTPPSQVADSFHRPETAFVDVVMERAIEGNNMSTEVINNGSNLNFFIY
jgi:hypothetical protein